MFASFLCGTAFKTIELKAIGVRCTQVSPADLETPKFDAECVRQAVEEILSTTRENLALM